MKYLIPGKTFLVGEYAALLGGAALGLATSPCFAIDYTDKKESSVEFHPNSLAGILYRQKIDFFQNTQIKLSDPYSLDGESLGGFGKSTAEYLSVLIPQIKTIECPKKFLQAVCLDYRNLSQDDVKPSGYDLLFQMLGQVAYVDVNQNKFETQSWPFPDLNFVIVSTGVKLKTHEHLKKLNLDSLQGLPEKSEDVIQSFLNKNQDDFLHHLNNWVRELTSRGLVAPHALDLKLKLEESAAVKLVKPCGALGSDTLIIFHQPSDINQIRILLQNLNLKIWATNQTLHSGLLQQFDTKQKNGSQNEMSHYVD